MTVFWGETYLYPTKKGVKEIGVIKGLRGTWVVAWISESGGRKAIRSKLLAPARLPGQVQFLLDRWAYIKGLSAANLPSDAATHEHAAARPGEG
jgi:hypothetical protein